MILLDDKQTEALEARRVAEEQDHPNQEPPPTYASLQPSGGAPPPAVAKTTNYVAITRLHTSIRETLVLDPALFVPPFLRPPLAPGETEAGRRNLRLESTHGHVYADVTLAPAGGEEVGEEREERGKVEVGRRRKVLMQLKSTHGGITAKIHGPGARSAFALHAASVNGDVRLHVPRSFHGPVVVAHRHGAVRFSDAVARALTTFGEADGARRCFLGDFALWTEGAGGAGWAGDELTVEVRNGNVKICYDDDVLGAPVKTRPSFLNRVFGF
ncbi:hypothetical protein BJ912DRAFT_27513 [Pholiota molesta]|nr:hypothetical protein BJ912DRAFT_27513 [Pholiota molesta]